MGESIKVDAEGLRAHAAMCDTIADAVTASPVTEPTTNRLHLATAAAVADGHDAVMAAATCVAARVAATASALHAAATSYTDTDIESAQDLTAIGQSAEA
ncbi:type VII secretion target [Mycolicibacterium llatzerense]|uniref:type VII secretion target n=1 Tax=Mycolicibacterium llatzerense TaxID=280871 RepID=UPI0008DD96C9|nr:type VII secretion target [Mycolicibacterium llatzerense]